jgi:uncharacterized RDD family membrane protein YckC
MKCPKCQCEEISDSGMCLWCGYQVNARAPETALDQSAADPELKPPHEQSVQELIDNKTSEQSEYPEKTYRAAEVFAHSPYVPEKDKDKRVLLSRTLSGLVDLIIVGLSAGAIIIATDFISGIRVLDSPSIAYFSVLIILVYFLYSLFFLVLSNQTIGMMIANLQVVYGQGENRLAAIRSFARCCGFLLSLSCLGLGLIWALFDRENQCLHDRLTHTHVVRVYGIASRHGSRSR